MQAENGASMVSRAWVDYSLVIWGVIKGKLLMFM